MFARRKARHAINFAYLSDIKNTLSPEPALEEVRKTTDRMFDEMHGYAEAASFDELSRITVKDALQKFLEGPDFRSDLELSSLLENVERNESRLMFEIELVKILLCVGLRRSNEDNTTLALHLTNLDALHQTMKRASRGRSRSEIVSRQMEQQVKRLQRVARKQLNTLGVYRTLGNRCKWTETWTTCECSFFCRAICW